MNQEIDLDLSFNNQAQLKAKLNKIKTTLEKKLGLMDQLQHKFKSHQQQSFLVTFNSIIQKMSDELFQAKTKFSNIDQELEKQKKVESYRKQVHFFRQQCLVLSQKVASQKQLIQKIVTENQLLLKQNQLLKASLEKKIKYNKRMSQKLGSLQIENSFQLSEIDKKVFRNGQDNTIIQTGSSKASRVKEAIDWSEKQQKQKKLATLDAKPSSGNHRLNFLRRRSINQEQFLSKFKHSHKQNELLILWEDCVKEWNSRYEPESLLTSQPKIKLIRAFFLSNRFIEIIRRKLFDEKCCNNWNCINNFSAVQQKDVLSNTRYQTSFKVKQIQSQSIYKSFRRKKQDVTDKLSDSYY